MQAQLPAFVNEFEEFYSDLSLLQIQLNIFKIEYQEKQSISIIISPIIIKFSQWQFEFLMEILKNNIQFNDKQDEHYIIKQDTNLQQIQQKELENSNNKDNNKTNPIEFNFHLTNLSLILSELKSNMQQVTPFFQFNLKSIQLNYEKLKTNYQNICFSIEIFQGHYFLSKCIEDKTISILPLFGEIGTKIIQVKNYLGDYIDQQLNEQQQIFDQKSLQQLQQNKEKQIEINIEIDPSNFKKIKLTIDKLQINAFLEGLMKISSVITNKNQKDDKIEENVEEPVVVYQENQSQVDPNQLIEISMNNLFLVFFHPEEENILVTELHLQMIYVANQGLNYQDFTDQIKQKNLTINEAYEINQTKKLCIDLKDISVSVCKRDQFNSQTFHNIKKQRLLLPFNIFLSMKCYNALTEDQNFFEKQFFDVNIEEIVIKFALATLPTYKLLFKTSSKEQNQEIEEQLLQEQPQEEDKKLMAILQKKKKAQKNSKITTIKLQKLATKEKKPGQQLTIKERSVHFSLQGLQLLLITQNNKINVPSFQFSIKNLELYNLANILLTTVQVQYWIEARYLNFINSRWEPIIEQTAMNIDFSQNPLTSPLMVLHFEVENQALLINLPTQMIAQSFQIIKGMEKLKNQEITIEQNVSPYFIQNWTGYSVEITRDFMNVQNEEKHNEQKIVLKNGEAINYQIESENKYFKDLLETVQENDYQNIYLVKIKILNDKIDFDPLKKINLDQVRTRKHYLKSKNQSHLFNFKLNIYFKSKGSKLSIVAACEIINNSKIFTLSSELVIENRCQNEVELKLIGTDNLAQDYKINCQDFLPVPFDMLDSRLKIKYKKQSEQWSETYLISKILSSSNNMTFTITLGQKQKFLCLTINKQYGKTHAIIEPPLKLKNYLVLQLQLKTFSKAKQLQNITLNPLEELEECSISLLDKLYLSLSIMDLQWTKPQLIYSEKDAIEKYIIIKDQQENYNSIEIYNEESFSGGKLFIFYSSCLVINQTGLPMTLYGQERNPTKKNEKNIKKQQTIAINKLHQIAGNFSKSNYQPVGNIFESIGLTEQGKIEKEVNVVPINAVQETTLRVKIGGDKVMECICKISFEKIEGVYILRKNVELNPKYVVLNSFDQDIKIRLVSLDDKSSNDNNNNNKQIFKKGERQPLFLIQEISNNIGIQLATVNNAYEWSGKVAIDSVGIYCLKLKKKNKEIKSIRKFIFIKLNVQMQSSIVFIEISQGNDMYLIENHLQNIKIKAEQKGFEKTGIKVVKSKEFGWDEPMKERLVVLKLQHEDDKFKIQQFSVEFDRLDIKERVMMKSSDGKSKIEIKIITKAVNKQKRIILEQIQSKNQLKFTSLFGTLDKEGLKYLDELTSSATKVDKLTVFKQISLYLNKFSLTIIQNHVPGEAIELINFYFENIECAIVETKLARTIQMRIQFINLDNLSSYHLLYQCPITPSKKQELIGPQSKKVFMDLLLEQNLSTDCIYLLKQVKFDIQPISVKIEWEFINQLIALSKNLMRFILEDEEQTMNSKILQIQKAEKYEFPWLDVKIKDKSKAIYIQEITLSPIEFYISFTMSSQASSENQEAIEFTGMITRALGFALVNLDDANIKVPGIHLNQCFDTFQGIQAKIFKHYKVYLLASLFKVFGSIDIIGNPVGLFTNIGTGVKDLIEKPIEGIVQGGPLQGGIALAKGAGSLITHTISGTFNSLNKITSSLAGGLSALTFDSAYLQQRQQLKNQKADSIALGINQAGISVFKGFEQGLTGIFLDPIRMARQQGAKGFFKGMFTGVTGVVLKPVAGILDAAAKTAEGVKGSANKFNDHANESWIRRPREFYGEEKFYKSFFTENAELLNLFQVFKDGKYKNIALYEIIWMDEKVIIVSEEWLVLLSKQKKKREWEVESSNILKTQQQQTGVDVILKKAVKKIPAGIIQIKEPNKDKQKMLVEKIEELIDTVKFI